MRGLAGGMIPTIDPGSRRHHGAIGPRRFQTDRGRFGAGQPLWQDGPATIRSPGRPPVHRLGLEPRTY